MNYLYIIDPSKFDGHALNTMPFVDVNTKNGADLLQSTYVHYKDQTFADYNKEKGGNLVAITWDDFYEKYMQPYLNFLQKPFKRTKKEDFWDGLECLPPKRWTKFDGGEYFFVGECYTADLYTCYVRKGNNYYTALRSIHTKSEDLINLKKI